MTATLIREHGGPERLLVETVQRPHPRAGEALVRVAACALNHLDIFVRRGTPGIAVRAAAHGRWGHRRLGAGARPADRRGRRSGRRCWSIPRCRTGTIGENAPGGLAEYVLVPAENLIALRPRRSSDRDGGAADRLRDRPSHAADPGGAASGRDAGRGGRQRRSRRRVRAARQARRSARDRLHQQRGQGRAAARPRCRRVRGRSRRRLLNAGVGADRPRRAPRSSSTTPGSTRGPSRCAAFAATGGW